MHTQFQVFEGWTSDSPHVVHSLGVPPQGELSFTPWKLVQYIYHKHQAKYQAPHYIVDGCPITSISHYFPTDQRKFSGRNFRVTDF